MPLLKDLWTEHCEGLATIGALQRERLRQQQQQIVCGALNPMSGSNTGLSHQIKCAKQPHSNLQNSAASSILPTKNIVEFVEKIGFHHGVHLRKINFEYFWNIFWKFFPTEKPFQYESLYVAGHMAGNKQRLSYEAYAKKMGANRGPWPPDTGFPSNL